MSDDYDFIMLTSEQCPHCSYAKGKLKDRIDSGQIKVMDVANDDGAMGLANKYNINSVPTIIVNDKGTNIGEVCDLKGDLTGVICKDKEVKF